MISFDNLVTSLSSNVDPSDSNLLIELITSFGVANVTDRHEKILSFPSFQTRKEPIQVWCHDIQYVAYIGRRITFGSETSFVPPGFFMYLQIQVCSFLTQNDYIELYFDKFIITSSGFQCLILVGKDCEKIDLIGRCSEGYALECIQTLDRIQNEIAKLNRLICPAVFFYIAVLSAIDLLQHHEVSHAYSTEEVISAWQNNRPLINGRGISETISQVMFLNDEAIHSHNTGRKSKVVFLQDEIFSNVDLLLSSEDTHQAVRYHEYLVSLPKVYFCNKINQFIP